MSMLLRRARQRLGVFVLLCLPISRHLFNHLRWEMRALWVRINNKLNPVHIYRIHKMCRGTDFSVNIACGRSGIKGWINLDLMKQPNLSVRYDCRKRIPFKAETVTRIRCEHFLEHLDYEEEAPFFLKSCHDSLRKGGVLRIAVPDVSRFMSAYFAQGKQEWLVLNWDPEKLPEGFYTRMDIINFVFRQREQHLYAYDFETLFLLLKKAGFEDIQKKEFGISQDPQLEGDGKENKGRSLYVEAIK